MPATAASIGAAVTSVGCWKGFPLDQHDGGSWCGNQRMHLVYYVDLLKIDYRDVIVAGEYESRNGNLVRVRDLSKPFEGGVQQLVQGGRPVGSPP